MTICDRCHAETLTHILSKFNQDTLCLDCKNDERLAPGYAAADAAEVASVRQGNYNFEGVGLSSADRAFLSARRAARKGGAL